MWLPAVAKELEVRSRLTRPPDSHLASIIGDEWEGLWGSVCLTIGCPMLVFWFSSLN
jgi:hypothetical protein